MIPPLQHGPRLWEDLSNLCEVTRTQPKECEPVGDCCSRPLNPFYFLNSNTKAWGITLAIGQNGIASSPLLLLKRDLLNTNLRDKSGYCACAATALQRNLNGIFSLCFILYLNTYLQNSGFSLLGGEEKKALKIHYI